MTLSVPPRAASPGTHRVPLAQLAGFRLVVVLWGGLALLDVGRLTAAPSYVALGALAVLVLAASIGMSPATAVAAGLIGSLLVNGFVVHRLGVLGFDGAPDLARLGLLTGLALVGTRVHR